MVGTLVEAPSIRPIGPADADALRAFHARLSAETTRRRFLAYHPDLSPAEVTWFTTVDHARREALVAVVKGDVVGVARYDRIGPHDAEVAIVVADDWQHRGVGTALLAALRDRALDAGVTEFRADALPDNYTIVRLLEHAGAVYDRAVDDGVATFRVRLEPS